MLSICFKCCIKLSKKLKSPYRISKIKLFIDQYNLKEINFPSHQKDWKMFELDNKSVVLNFLFVPYNLQKEGTHTDQNII